jgi:superkiller protein 3
VPKAPEVRAEQSETISDDQISGLIQRGRFEDALVALERMLSQNPGCARTWSAKGDVLCSLGRVSEALAAYDRALEINPDDARAWLAKAEAYKRFGKQERNAVKAYRRALEIDSTNVAAWTSMAELLSELHEPGEAASAYQRALEIEPGNPRLCTAAATTMTSLGQKEAAVLLYDRALHIEPGNASVWVSKAQLHWAMKQLDSAENAFGRAVELDPKDAWVWVLKGQVHDELGQDSEARYSYERALQLKPHNVDFITRCLKGPELYEALVRHVKDDPQAMEDVARRYKWVAWDHSSGWEGLISLANEVVARYPNNLHAAIAQWKILEGAEQYRAALAALDRVCAMEPDNFWVWYCRHNLCMKLNDIRGMVVSESRKRQAREKSWPEQPWWAG